MWQHRPAKVFRKEIFGAREYAWKFNLLFVYVYQDNVRRHNIDIHKKCDVYVSLLFKYIMKRIPMKWWNFEHFISIFNLLEIDLYNVFSIFWSFKFVIWFILVQSDGWKVENNIYVIWSIVFHSQLFLSYQFTWVECSLYLRMQIYLFAILLIEIWLHFQARKQNPRNWHSEYTTSDWKLNLERCDSSIMELKL